MAATAGCGGGEERPLRIAAIPWPSYEYFFLADELGYFQDEGLDIRLVEQTSLRDSRRAFANGLVDGLLGTPVDVAALAEDGVRSAVVHQVYSYSNGCDVLISRQSVRSLRDLRGKRVAVEQGLGTYFLVRALKSVELELQDVVLVERPHATAVESLSSGSVDAIHAFPPTLEQLASLGDDYHILFSSRQLPNEIHDVLVVDPCIAKNRQVELAKLTRAYDRARRYADAEPERAFRIMAKREGVPPEALSAMMHDDLELIDEADREEYLAPAGPVSVTIARAREVLRESQVTRREFAARGVHGEAPPTWTRTDSR